MSGVNRVVFTEHFWETYEEFRRSGHLRAIKRAITNVIRQKMISTNAINARDKAFTKKSGGLLAGIQHIAIRRNPDCVLFYVIQDQALYLAKLGSHHDYPNAGKHFHTAERTANKVWSAVKDGDRPSPKTMKAKWSRPAELTNNAELFELDIHKLYEIMVALDNENHDTAIFRQLFGREIEELDELESWLEETASARKFVKNVIENIPKSGNDMFAIWDAEESDEVSAPSP